MKTVQNGGFPLDCSWYFVGLVEKMKEKVRVGSMVYSREVGDILSGHNPYSLT